jgi:hypothetical protein
MPGKKEDNIERRKFHSLLNKINKAKLNTFPCPEIDPMGSRKDIQSKYTENSFLITATYIRLIPLV